MIQDRTVLALIPARGGSKGITDKNIYPLCGKPLIAYTVGAAKESRYVDKVLVSTDSERIAGTAREYGAEVPFLRPAVLASDTAKSIGAVLHALAWLQEHGEYFDILVLLQPTSPLRTTGDIDGALERFMECGERPLASVSEAEDNPVLVRTMADDGRLERLLPVQSTVRRQDMRTYYRVNGSIYVNKVNEITMDTSFNDNGIPFIIPRARSVDIDEMKDIAVANYYLMQRVEL